MSARTRIAVFIDYQNCYGAARRAFHRPGSPGKCGQLAPHRMASVLAAKESIDVKLAIDIVMLAVQGAYDVGIIASCDTDLAPVAEALLELHQRSGAPQVRAIAWVARQNRIRVAGRQLTHHWIDERDYRAMQDLTDYAA